MNKKSACLLLIVCLAMVATLTVGCSPKVEVTGTLRGANGQIVLDGPISQGQAFDGVVSVDFCETGAPRSAVTMSAVKSDAIGAALTIGSIATTFLGLIAGGVGGSDNSSAEECFSFVLTADTVVQVGDQFSFTVRKAPSASEGEGEAIAEGEGEASEGEGEGEAIVFVAVPNIVGLLLPVAQTAITGAGLAVGTVTQATSTRPIDEVLSQNPAGGGTLPRGSQVNLTVSAGPESVTVPDIRGLTQPEATIVIGGTCLILGVVSTEASETVPSGIVISYSPMGSVACGTRITIVVSTGSAPTGPLTVGFKTPADGSTVILPSTVTCVITLKGGAMPYSVQVQWYDSFIDHFAIAKTGAVSGTRFDPFSGTTTALAGTYDGAALSFSKGFSVPVSPPPGEGPPLSYLTVWDGVSHHQTDQIGLITAN